MSLMKAGLVSFAFYVFSSVFALLATPCCCCELRLMLRQTMPDLMRMTWSGGAHLLCFGKCSSLKWVHFAGLGFDIFFYRTYVFSGNGNLTGLQV